MERIKVASLVVIAAALAAQLVVRDVPAAYAQDLAPVKCTAWYMPNDSAFKVEKAVERSLEYAEPIRTWIEANGQVVFHSSVVKTSPANGQVQGFIDIVCAR